MLALREKQDYGGEGQRQTYTFCKKYCRDGATEQIGSTDKTPDETQNKRQIIVAIFFYSWSLLGKKNRNNN